MSLALGVLGCSPERPNVDEVEPASTPVEAAAPVEPELELELELPQPPSNEPNAEFPPLPSGRMLQLAPVVVRDGPLFLRGSGEHGYLLVDGEPRELGRTGPKPPVPADLTAIRGRTSLDFRVDDYVEVPGGDAFSSTSSSDSRSGLVDAQLYRRSEGRWTAVDLQANGFAYYDTIFLREGGVFGLQELRGASKTFVRLGGVSTATLPVAPSTPPIEAPVVTTDGSLYALQHRYRLDSDERIDPPILLFWPPGRAEPERITLPEVAGTSGLRLSASGADVLLFGSPRYLAIGRGRDWQRIRVVLPDGEEVGDSIDAALRTPSGELWITLDGDFLSNHLLHRAPDKGWTLVKPPALPAALNPELRWGFDGEWMEIERYDEGSSIFTSLVWAAGRMWIMAEYPLAEVDGALPTLQRTVLYTVGEIGRGATKLPAIDRQWFDQATKDTSKPGACPFFSIVLGSDAKPTEDQRAALEELDALAGTIVYVGELAGRRELVLQAFAMNEAEARQLVRDVGTALGTEVHADCRPRDLIEVVLDRR